MVSSFLLALQLLFLLSIVEANQENPLGQYRWQNRLILIFDGIDNEVMTRDQINAFKGQEPELDDRDLLILHIDQNGVYNGLNGKTLNFKPEDLRRSFGVSPADFSLLLIGKDGGVKLRNAKQVAVKDIFALIDGMPMRRSEMRRKKKN